MCASRPHRIDVLTLFPPLFDGFLSQSILSRAIEKGLVQIERFDIRSWAEGKAQAGRRSAVRRRAGDGLDGPGGGGGDRGRAGKSPSRRAVGDALAAGAPARSKRVGELAGEPRLILLCGRYEGFDERIIEILQPELISVGDYILSGGEVAAMVLIDAVVRLIPGVLGDERSAVDESFGPDGGLEYPQYTRPRVYRGLAVPEILLSGDHAAIARWRREHRR